MSTRCTISLTPRLHAYQDAYDDPPGMVWLEITSDGFTCDSGTGEVTVGMPLAEWDAAVEAYVARRTERPIAWQALDGGGLRAEWGGVSGCIVQHGEGSVWEWWCRSVDEARCEGYAGSEVEAKRVVGVMLRALHASLPREA